MVRHVCNTERSKTAPVPVPKGNNKGNGKKVFRGCYLLLRFFNANKVSILAGVMLEDTR